MDRYTRYYANQSSGRGEIGTVYRASFRGQRGNGIGSFFRGLFRFVKTSLYSGAKAVGKEALKTGSNITTDILNKEPEQPMGNIFKNPFNEGKNKLEQKKTTASNVPIVAPNVITSLSLTGNRDWVLCIEYEVFI